MTQDEADRIFSAVGKRTVRPDMVAMSIVVKDQTYVLAVDIRHAGPNGMHERIARYTLAKKGWEVFHGTSKHKRITIRFGS